MKLFSSLGCSDFLVFLPGVDCSRNELATCFTLRRGISYITVATHFFSVEVKWISFSFKEKKRNTLSDFFFLKRWHSGVKDFAVFFR